MLLHPTVALQTAKSSLKNKAKKKKNCVELVQQHKENKKQYKLCLAKLEYHTSITTMLCHLRAKLPAESGPSTTNQPSMTTCVTRKSKFDDQCAFVEGEDIQSLMAFVQAEYRNTITARLEKLYDDNAAALCSNLTTVEQQTTDLKQSCNICILLDLISPV